MLSAILMSCRQSRRTQAYLEDEVVDLESLEVAGLAVTVSPATHVRLHESWCGNMYSGIRGRAGAAVRSLTVGGERLK
jgi:3-deoxy-D-manno-octulosonate 8-phosphate phosphatase KdsC-like HAD superfamily phosphatase